jgi:mono/diheme cytochrome c family protein
MKVLLPVFLIATVFSGILILNTSFRTVFDKSKTTMPKEVNAIIDQSCFGCHNTDSQNEDAREELDFKTLDDLQKVRKITKLKDIAKVVEEGDMPPKKFLEKRPEKKLTEEQIKILTEWAEKEAKKLIGS